MAPGDQSLLGHVAVARVLKLLGTRLAVRARRLFVIRLRRLLRRRSRTRVAQRKRHARAGSHGAGNRHLPLLRLDERFCYREAEPAAGTRAGSRIVSPIKALENVRQVLDGNPFACVADTENG